MSKQKINSTYMDVKCSWCNCSIPISDATSASDSSIWSTKWLCKGRCKAEYEAAKRK